ncbi:MAG: biotin carboxylase N-terminal domain-containing protein [Solirubrobacteraceae bacterium]|nr:biotin carboxylase N-terminal domain-containing protein [Solirubrobacteraceae bacterium]
MLTRLAVVNRGEAAMRLITAVRDRNEGRSDDPITVIALHTDGERDAMFVRHADEAHPLGPATTIDGSGAHVSAYLDHARLERALRAVRADAVWPGWGFVAEDPAFADLCRRIGVAFVGPPGDVMRALGDKIRSKLLAERSGVPVAPWSGGAVDTLAAARAHAAQIGYPLLIKAAAGGGGRGMRVARARDMLALAFATCQAEAAQAFGSSELYLEKFVEEARHVEVQVLGDRNGIRVHLGERDCSVQRRHQKLLEESPASAISEETRAGLYKAALTVANSVNYVSAGTVEFLVARNGTFYFIEMNTRIQVEHPVTEMVTGIDLVREQIRIASGEPLGYKQRAITVRGHAIECRINAEDPEHFVPSPGTVTAWLPPGGYGVRVDSHMMPGAVVPPYYDSLIAKIIVHGHDRAEAIARMQRALSETVLEGVKTTIPYHQKLLADPAFLSGEHTLPRLEVGP